MIEENEERGDDDDMYPEYGGTATRETEDEEASNEPADDLRRAIVDAHREVESINEK
jgi:hypothetical protein